MKNTNITLYTCKEYSEWETQQVDLDFLPAEFLLIDHLEGFDINNNNKVLSYINTYAINNNKRFIVYWKEYLPNKIKQLYSALDIRVSTIGQKWITSCHDIDIVSTKKSLENFVCSFNGSNSVSRQLLVSAIYKLKWYDSEYISKNFAFECDTLDGNIMRLAENSVEEQFFRKFIISDNDKTFNEFCKNIHGFSYKPFDHLYNMQVLFKKINNSFIQVCAESTATSYFPYITEKFLYPVLAKTFWLSYAQPGYYEYLEKFYGFKKFNIIFDYSFDTIINPVVRLIKILEIIGKFQNLTVHEWHDLYQMEQEILEFNYDWFKSKSYMKRLNEYK